MKQQNIEFGENNFSDSHTSSGRQVDQREMESPILEILRISFANASKASSFFFVTGEKTRWPKTSFQTAHEGVTFQIDFSLQAKKGRKAALFTERLFREQRHATVELELLTTVL